MWYWSRDLLLGTYMRVFREGLQDPPIWTAALGSEMRPQTVDIIFNFTFNFNIGWNIIPSTSIATTCNHTQDGSFPVVVPCRIDCTEFDRHWWKHGEQPALYWIGVGRASLWPCGDAHDVRQSHRSVYQQFDHI